MKSVKASMRHTPETIRRLSSVQYDTFQFGAKAVQILCGVILIGVGISGAGSLTLSALCAFFGCWLCMNTNVPARMRANKLLEATKGELPYTEYEFSTSSFTLTADGSRETIGYDKLIRLVEDNGYFYLYISKMSAYMIDKTTLTADTTEFRELVETGSGLKFRRPTTLLNFSLKTLTAGRRRKTK